MRIGLLSALLFSAALALGQEALNLTAEPHYHLLLENDLVRVFALTLHPDESAFVHFQRTFMTVALHDGEIIVWDDGKSPIQHYQVHMGETSFRCWNTFCLTSETLVKGLSGGYRNDRQKDYRNITVEFLDPTVGWSMPEGGLLSPPASMFVGGAIVAEVSLQPGESFPAPEREGPELLIAVSAVDLTGANKLRLRKAGGEVSWISAAGTSALTNSGREPASFVVVEFHPDDPLSAPTRRNK